MNISEFRHLLKIFGLIAICWQCYLKLFLIPTYFINELFFNFLNAIVSSIIGCNIKDIKLVIFDLSFMANL